MTECVKPSSGWVTDLNATAFLPHMFNLFQRVLPYVLRVSMLYVFFLLSQTHAVGKKSWYEKADIISRSVGYSSSGK